MLSIFKKSKSKRITELVCLTIGNASIASGKIVDVADPSLKKVSKKITDAWLTALPKKVIEECQLSTLAGFILVAEAQVYSKEPNTIEFSKFYIESAKLAAKDVCFRGASGELNFSDYKLLMIMAKLANKAGLKFYDEFLEFGG